MSHVTNGSHKNILSYINNTSILPLGFFFLHMYFSFLCCFFSLGVYIPFWREKEIVHSHIFVLCVYLKIFFFLQAISDLISHVSAVVQLDLLIYLDLVLEGVAGVIIVEETE